MSFSKTCYTRRGIECPLVGSPADFKDNILPTQEDVLKCFLWIRYSLKPPDSGKEPTVSEVSSILAPKILSLWEKASIPTVTAKRVLQLIKTQHERYLKLLWYPKVKRNENYDLKVENYKAENKKLFDISACKCEIFEECSCSKEKKVPSKERPFLIDQRGSRKMAIGGVDAKETAQLIKKARRIEKMQQREKPYNNFCPENDTKLTPKIKSSKASYKISAKMSACSNLDAACEIPSTSKNSLDKIRTPKNTLKLPTLAKVCDRYGLSDRSAAAVATAVLQDVGIVTRESLGQVIDKNKLRRARDNSRNQITNSIKFQPINSIYFDGRKDKTLTIEEIDGTSHRRTIVEEHISLVQEPGSVFLGHTTPSSGSAKDLLRSIVDFFQENEYDLSGLLAVGCDGTVVNTGSKNGVIAQLELKIGRPLQRLICQLHANELPLRHLFQHLDGQTTGPTVFSGSLGKLIEQCENLVVIQYEAIDCKLPAVDFCDLSTDQKYLYKICLAISSGQCSADLANQNPGKVSHSRWLTLANRLLRLYISTEKPSSNLKELTTFVLRVYAPMWFSIKLNPSCKNGAKHVWQTIKLSRYLRGDLRAIIDPVIQRNAFFAHPENMLVCMISDPRPHIRQLAMRRILNAKKKENPEKIRSFIIPKLNFEADDYTNLIDWQNIEVTPPPLLHDLEVDELENIIRETPNEAIEVTSYPCHTQAVERCVKLVTEAALSVVGSKKRDGFIKARLSSRKLMPQFESKKDFLQ